ncbi:beta-2 adrenergic receptor-like [Tubulanus polymorphus]|uniref:beta-2 adrenergic receptor-like n=1 Tax=Tubulanus polymorphus TaxID=672921 RepID=UPI003DA4789A
MFSENEFVVEVVIIAVLLAEGTAIVIGNGLTIHCVRSVRSLQKMMYFLVANLAASDLLVGISLIVYGVYRIFQTASAPRECVLVSRILCKGWFVTKVVSVSSSVQTLVIIAFDQYFSIRLPFRYQRISVKKYYRAFCVAVPWITASATMVPLVVFNLLVGQKTFDPRTQFCVFFSVLKDEYLIVCASAICGICSLLFAFHSCIYQIAKKHIFRLELLGGYTTTATSRKYRYVSSISKSKKSIMTIIIVLGAFSLCWTPNLIISILKLRYGKLSQIYSDMAIILIPLNSIFNPLIYAWRFKEFRNAYKTMYSRKCRCRRASPLASPRRSPWMLDKSRRYR